VYGEWPENGLDHKNGIPGDDRLDNLRKATQSQNLMNSPAVWKHSSIRKGVSYDKSRSLFRAYITVRGRQKQLGRFPTLEDAVNARAAAERVAFGEFARAM
jgi:hypothetical protein